MAARSVSNANGVASRFHVLAATPLGLFAVAAMSQGSSFLATLGFSLESLWDSIPEFPKSISPNDLSFLSRSRAMDAPRVLSRDKKLG